MKERLNYLKQSPKLGQKFLEFSQALLGGSLPVGLLDLVNIRASQINGCAFCLDMHVKEAKIRGERELRLHHVAIWRESTLLSPRARAALQWAELMTRLGHGGVPDEAYEAASTHFTEVELADLNYAVVAIN